MPSPSPKLLLTRPAAQSARFAQAFLERFGPAIPVLIAPLMAVEEIVPEGPLPPAQTLIFSSETAVAAARGLGLPKGNTAWCVGPRTAEAARGAGFRAVEGPGDGAALARAMIAAGVVAPCLFLRGQEVAGDIAGALNSAGTETHSVVIYRQSPLPLSSAARSLLAGGAPVVLPLFSPRSARLAAAEIGTPAAPLRIASLSPAVAAAAGAIPAARRAVAARPDAPAMLDALVTLLADAP